MKRLSSYAIALFPLLICVLCFSAVFAGADSDLKFAAVKKAAVNSLTATEFTAEGKEGTFKVYAMSVSTIKAECQPIAGLKLSAIVAGSKVSVIKEIAGIVSVSEMPADEVKRHIKLIDPSFIDELKEAGAEITEVKGETGTVYTITDNKKINNFLKYEITVDSKTETFSSLKLFDAQSALVSETKCSGYVLNKKYEASFFLVPKDAQKQDFNEMAPEVTEKLGKTGDLVLEKTIVDTQEVKSEVK
ncbi:MAG: hypothetical protein BWY32_01460 [bacterium ADurb.Bin243]|nr:MAG: hypothetical protein BWY32_01460 [bacterium ADurb.Bin243]HOD41949.1 hypothetical protein [Candidatus Wallbacteria bacterium]